MGSKKEMRLEKNLKHEKYYANWKQLRLGI